MQNSMREYYVPEAKTKYVQIHCYELKCIQALTASVCGKFICTKWNLMLIFEKFTLVDKDVKCLELSLLSGFGIIVAMYKNSRSVDRCFYLLPFTKIILWKWNLGIQVPKGLTFSHLTIVD